MSDYAVIGKKGTGKSKFAVIMIREALHAGRRVATNLDVHLEHLVPASSRASIYRIPDKPTAADLFGIGHGNPDSYDEDKNGVLVLDELGTWLNARSFQDPERAPVLDWLIHARKYGWDVYYLMQGLGQVDKQIRESLVEYTIRCVRMDKMLVPVIGWALKWFTAGAVMWRLPRFHMAGVRLGIDPRGMVVDRHFYRGDDVHKAYDTRQVFSPTYDKGLFSVLSAWHMKGRYLSPKEMKLTLWQRICAWRRAPARRQAHVLKPKHPLVAAVAKAYRHSPDLALQHVQRLIALGALDSRRASSA